MARFLPLLFLVAASHAFGWGTRGHEMAARVAAQALPKDMTPFFLRAGERLAYLCPEPDRWRYPNAPALNAINTPDHYFDLEYWGADPIPATRYDLLIAAIKRGLVSETKPVSGLGTATVAIAELAEKLVAAFRQWRETTDATDTARLVRSQVEENAIYVAGVLAHFVTDLSNPMHTSVHHNGWAEGYPNPRGFPSVANAKGIHARFESTYVERAVTEKDLHPSAPRRIGPWNTEMEKFVRRNNTLLEAIYEFDQKAAFGSGQESREAHDFTAQRLADGASMLRDIWYTAWLVSGEEWLTERVIIYPRNGRTLLDLTKEGRRVETKSYPFGEMVTAIGNRKNGLEGRYWIYLVNGKPSSKSADKYVTSEGERIEWRFEPHQ